ncbi:phosphotransferase [uncultured Formosa sp.]|uniref:phosphotransferase n=1 Tax=uncultured Formosa sp. TaxID=255435 RepID=UPI002625FD44|nr:phosphotransferase [uncultured Formosa sp.]
MSVFPVTTSTLSSSALRLFLIEIYGFYESCSCTLFRTGMNHTYFVSNENKKYVFRVYCHEWRTKNQIEEELRLLNMLKAHTISISYPIPDKKGILIQHIQAPEGLRFGVLFSFAEGEKLRFMDEGSCFSVGKLMAEFHKITENESLNRIQYTSKTLLDLPFTYANAYFKDTLPEMEFIKAQSKEIKKQFAAVDKTKMRSGIVHLDIWYDNMSVKNSTEITVFDFDFCGNGWCILDVAYFCKQLFHIEVDKSIYELKKAKFLAGYQSVLQLSEDELQLIPVAGMSVWIFYLGVQSQRFDWSNIFLTENYLKMYIGRMRSWQSYSKEM